MKLRELWPGLLLGAAFVFCLLMMTLKLAQSPASMAKRDGLTPETSVAAGRGTNLSTLAPVVNTLPILDTKLWWNAGIDKSYGRCYLSVTLPTVKRKAFVSVPDDWCEGMR